MKLFLVVVLSALSIGSFSAGPATGKAPTYAPAIIAIVGESGLNPLHEEFRQIGGPMPALPKHKVVRLPGTSGDFSDLAKKMEAGPLGRLEPGQLYRIDKTRLLIYVPAGLEAPHNLISGEVNSAGTPHRRHGTGATGAAIGAKYGTAPEAWAVFIPTSDPSGFRWLAEQDWVDVASVSSYGVQTFNQSDGALPCPQAEHIREFTKDRVFFASSGNSEHSSFYLYNAMPEMYLVGGVDADGNAVMAPRVPSSADQEEIAFSAPYATRTFETGDRYEFPAAKHDSVDATERFGGTSGATPSTAGRAASLVMAARKVLGDDGSRPSGALATQGRGVRKVPTKGPLADGDFTSEELASVLHASATPKLVGPARYFVEGYGGLSDAATDLALRILRGDEVLMSRTDDDTAHQVSEDVRAAMFDTRGCG